jgi:4-amino-4-deoxy-L-arabinose transferase-like glycosyltransferase
MPSTRSALLIAIVFAGFAVRLGWTLWTAPVPPFFSDAVYYDATARSLAGGHGYSVLLTHEGFFPGGDATAFFPPGYPFLLATAYVAFGESFAVARLLNVVLGTLTLPLVYLIGRRLFSETTGLVAAGLAAVQPSLVFWTPVMLSETAFTFLFTGAATALVYARRSDASLSWRMVALGGALVGVATLTRGQAIILVAAAALWWALSATDRTIAIKAGVLALAACLVVITPWAVRNTLVFNYPVLLSTNVGYNLRVGHAPYSTGRFVDPDDIYFGHAETYQDLELLLHRNGLRMALDYAAGNPGREVELSIEKARWMWRPDWDVLVWAESFGLTPLPEGLFEPLKTLVVAAYWATIGLAFISVAAWRSGRHGLAFVALACLAWTAVHVAFFGEPRFRLPIMPLVLLASAVGALKVVAWVSRQPPALGRRARPPA